MKILKEGLTRDTLTCLANYADGKAREISSRSLSLDIEEREKEKTEYLIYKRTWARLTKRIQDTQSK
jgi:hypothetical protein